MPLICSWAAAQQCKPCGTSVLARHRPSPSPGMTRSGLSSAVTYQGEKRGLVILVSFPNQAFSSDNPRQVWHDIISREGYADNGAPGSVSDYFRDQSYGQFRIRFDVMGPVEMSQPYQYYGKNKQWGPGDEFDQNDGQLVEEACRAVADSVRFADYDWDGDGMVDLVYILYAGYGEADSWKKFEDLIWPHKGNLSFDWAEAYPDALSLQGLVIDKYACSNELALSGRLAGHGHICHEFSHCLGLPDLYDTVKGKSVVGYYDLMDSGNYNGEGWCPPGYSSYERYACGWLQPEPTDAPREIKTLAPLHEEPDARIYREHADDHVYFLIERRNDDSWDHSLPSHGLMAWRIDYDEDAWFANMVNAGKTRVSQGPLSIVPTAVSAPVGERRVNAVYHFGSFRIIRYSDGTIQKVIGK